jgi:hypothetical protein
MFGYYEEAQGAWVECHPLIASMCACVFCVCVFVSLSLSLSPPHPPFPPPPSLPLSEKSRIKRTRGMRVFIPREVELAV